MMTLITAKQKQETTRFVVGCQHRAAALEDELRKRNYMVKSKEVADPPDRSAEERARASTIIGEIYGGKK